MTKYGKAINLRAEVLQHQCGMVYKATDASLLSSGVQPFVVEVIISRFLDIIWHFDNFSWIMNVSICRNSSNFSVKCVGTLISPGHVLTLASCFMIEGVKNKLLKRYFRLWSEYIYISDFKDPFKIQENVIQKCGFDHGWKNCRRWFHLNEIIGYEIITKSYFYKNRLVM